MNALYLELGLSRSVPRRSFRCRTLSSFLFLGQVPKLEMSSIPLALIATLVIIDLRLNKDSPTFVFLAKKSLGFPASFSLLIPTTSLVS